MEEGIDSGMTYHEASMTRVSKQFDNLLNYSNVEDTGFYNPIHSGVCSTRPGSGTSLLL